MRVKSYPAGAVLCLGSLVLIIGSCRKMHDVTCHPPEHCGISRADSCQIVSFMAVAPGTHNSFTAKYTITYNELGNPISVVSNTAQPGNADYTLQYDACNRLTGLLAPSPYGGNSGYERWDRYGYNHQNQIVTDTCYNLGVLRHIRYEYDSLGRMVLERDSVLTYGDSTCQYVFKYDALGNKLRPYAGYDRNPCIYRTNPVWMFLVKDYSLNNYFSPTQYNSHGLPTKVSTYDPVDLFPIAYGDVTITYSCP
jgi:hypothetical protein